MAGHCVFLSLGCFAWLEISGTALSVQWARLLSRVLCPFMLKEAAQTVGEPRRGI